MKQQINFINVSKYMEAYRAMPQVIYSTLTSPHTHWKAKWISAFLLFCMSAAHCIVHLSTGAGSGLLDSLRTIPSSVVGRNHCRSSLLYTKTGYEVRTIL